MAMIIITALHILGFDKTNRSGLVIRVEQRTNSL